MNYKDAVTIVYRDVRPLGAHTLHLSCGDAANIVVNAAETSPIADGSTVGVSADDFRAMYWWQTTEQQERP